MYALYKVGVVILTCVIMLSARRDDIESAASSHLMHFSSWKIIECELSSRAESNVLTDKCISHEILIWVSYNQNDRRSI